MNNLIKIRKNITGDNMILIITLVIFFVFMYLFFTPNSISLKVNIRADDYFTKITTLPNTDNELKIKLLNAVTVYKKELFTNKKDTKNKKKDKDNSSGNNFIYRTIRK